MNSVVHSPHFWSWSLCKDNEIRSLYVTFSLFAATTAAPPLSSGQIYCSVNKISFMTCAMNGYNSDKSFYLVFRYTKIFFHILNIISMPSSHKLRHLHALELQL